MSSISLGSLRTYSDMKMLMKFQDSDPDNPEIDGTAVNLFAIR